MSLTRQIGFAWYDELPRGVERKQIFVSDSRKTLNWFVHHLPGHTGTILDRSADPVISLSFSPHGVIERVIDGRSQQASLQVDTVTLTPAATACEWSWDGDAFDILDVYIPFELMQAAWSEIFGANAGPVNLRPELVLDDPCILFLLKSLMATIEAPRSHSALLLESMTDSLVLSLISSSSNLTAHMHTYHNALSKSIARRLREYVEDNLHEDISLDDMAEIAGMSRFHFTRLFKQAFSVTPIAYLNERRMSRACQLLGDARLSIGDIAVLCGFSEPSYFATRFRKAYKLSPRAFRNSL